MLEARAIVVHIQGRNALVETKGGVGCGHCDSVNGCGSSKLSQMFCSKPRRFSVDNEANAAVGDEVQITLADGVLLRSSIVIYVLPLSLLLSGGLIGAQWAGASASRDAYAVIGAVCGLIGGFILAKWMTKNRPVTAVARAIESS